MPSGCQSWTEEASAVQMPCSQHNMAESVELSRVAKPPQMSQNWPKAYKIIFSNFYPAEIRSSGHLVPPSLCSLNPIILKHVLHTPIACSSTNLPQGLSKFYAFCPALYPGCPPAPSPCNPSHLSKLFSSIISQP